MLAPAATAIRTAVAAANAAGWLLRWPNEAWPAGQAADSNDVPTNALGEPVPFIEAEIIGGENSIRAFSSPGNRLFIHEGLLRLYLAVPARSGNAFALQAADQFAAALQRTEIAAPAPPQVVRILDVSTQHGVASVARGNCFVLMCSAPFDFYYTS